jgi:hypothetical protein
VTIKIFNKDVLLGSFTTKIALFKKSTQSIVPITTTQGDIGLTFVAELNALSKRMQVLCYDFTGNFVDNLMIRDMSGRSNHGHFKVLNKDNFPKAIVAFDLEMGIGFDGFNGLESKDDPLIGTSEFSISLWFLQDDMGKDQPLVSNICENGGLIVNTYSVKLMDSSNDAFVDTTNEASTHMDVLDSGILRKLGEWNHKVVIYSGSHLREFINNRLVTEIKTGKKIVGGGRVVIFHFLTF